MTFWMVVVALVVVLGAAAWWFSGRSRPLQRMDDEAKQQRADQVAHDEVTGIRMPPPRAGL
jgi:hypothetical protein